MKTARERIEAAWIDKNIKVDWLELEQTLRQILREGKDNPARMWTMILTIDEAIGAFTKRGMEIQ